MQSFILITDRGGSLWQPFPGGSRALHSTAQESAVLYLCRPAVDPLQVGGNGHCTMPGGLYSRATAGRPWTTRLNPSTEKL